MSKYFDKASNAKLPGADSSITPFEVDVELAAAKDALDQEAPPSAAGNAAAELCSAALSDSIELTNEIADLRLARCRKIELPAAGHPLVLRKEQWATAAAESYKSLRTRLLAVSAKRGIHSVVLTSAAQGDGKTLTAFNLACCCAQLANTPVLLIDGDLRTCGLSRLAGNVASPGLGEILSGKARYEEAIVATDLPNLYILGAGASSVSPTELFSNQAWKQFVGWTSEVFKLVLVDAPPIAPVADLELIASSCEAILMVVRARKTQREGLEKALALIADSKKLIGVVWNGVQSGGADGYYYYGYGNDR